MLEIEKVPKIIIDLVKLFYCRTKCQILHTGELSESLSIENGVKQGAIYRLFHSIRLTKS